MSISGSAGKALFSGGRYNGSLENYIHLVLQQLSGGQVRLAVPPSQRTMINGIPAAYTTARANTSSGPVDVSVFAYQWNPNTVYHFVMLTQGRGGHRSIRADGASRSAGSRQAEAACDPPANHRCA